MAGTDEGTAILAGRVIDGRFRLEARLGEGTLGDVWRATDLELHSAVAVKLLTLRFRHAGSGYIASLLREAALAMRIDCPHVVRVLECGRSPELGPYIVMEMLDGLDLFEHLVCSGTLSIEEMAAIVAQISIALEALHAQDVFHGDVKPENIVLAARPGGANATRATLIDFGIAQDGKAPIDEPGGIVWGTRGYLSPERVQGAAGPGAMADLWALAVVAYQCLVGELPFGEEALDTVCIGLDRATFVPPGAFRPDVTPQLDVWFRRALALATSERFASAASMREALIEACSPFPLESAPFAGTGERASGVRWREDQEVTVEVNVEVETTLDVA